MSQQECQKRWYEKNKEQHIKNVSIRNTIVRNENKQKVYEYLKKHPCIDCGESDIVVLDFDHVKDEKFMGVSRMINSVYKWSRIQQEIEKCVIRCANCHRRKTARQFNWLSLNFASLAER